MSTSITDVLRTFWAAPWRGAFAVQSDYRDRPALHFAADRPPPIPFTEPGERIERTHVQLIAEALGARVRNVQDALGLLMRDVRQVPTWDLQ